MNPKDINWITDDIEAKISPHKPDNILLSKNVVDHAIVKAAFEAIFSPTLSNFCMVQPISRRANCKKGFPK